MSEQKTVKVRILRDFWDKAGERHRKGKIVEMPMEAALEGVEKRTVETWTDAKAKAAQDAEEAKQAKRARK